ncbi:MAG: alkaline phosphatase [Planctomycetaceae bacterium]|nr:alkaline phosphatase [Planctomycetaceae bacterium]
MPVGESRADESHNTPDTVAAFQTQAIADGKSDAAHWGVLPDKYTQWGTHSNRLVPVYTFGTLGAGDGVDLSSYIGANSVYRSEPGVRQLYGYVPEGTVNEAARWLDQTNIADLQRAALAAGRRHLFLVVFDGMDWQTTQAAAIVNQGKVAYTSGRGRGTRFQTYAAGGTTQFGFMVTSPHNDGTKTSVDDQTVENPGGTVRGGYAAAAGGDAPWVTAPDMGYLIGKPSDGFPKHAYTDSASSATSMTAGIKTYNNAINVDPAGQPVSTVFHEAQQAGFRVGVVSSVPVSHATPACAYAHNVTRKDYQDISRDMLGLPSIAHPTTPLPGLDVVIGGGFGTRKDASTTQGANYEPGNLYLADSDLAKVDAGRGGKYVTDVSVTGQDAGRSLRKAAATAAQEGKRLLGFYGIGRYNGHLPFQTANGDYQPVAGRGKAESYTKEELAANPTIRQMTQAAITVLSADERAAGFVLMVEAGDVDWANHDNNIDNSIGALNSGDGAVRAIIKWVEANSNWEESLMIVTADHGHYFHLTTPEALLGGQ